MPIRKLAVLLVLLIGPAFSQQQGNVTQRINQRLDSHDNPLRPEPIPEADQRAIRLRAVDHDVQEWSALSSSLQSDLQQLQKGLLTKELNQKLKKIEKLSKRIRQEVAQ